MNRNAAEYDALTEFVSGSSNNSAWPSPAALPEHTHELHYRPELHRQRAQAEKTRMDVVSQNIANAHTTRDVNGEAYKRKVVSFESALDASTGGTGVRVSKSLTIPLPAN